MNLHETSFIFYVEDQGRGAAFYRAVLELEPRLDVPGMTEFQLGAQSVLGLMPAAGIKRLLGDAIPDATPSSTPKAEVYLVVDEPALYHTRALEHGARELSALQERPWGDTAAYCADLDGHVLAFASRPH